MNDTVNTQSSNRSTSRMICLILSACWLIGFCCYFFLFSSPNGNYDKRWHFFLVLHEIILNALFPLQQEGVPYIGWKNLLQRLDILLIASAVIATAWCSGNIILRCLRPAVRWRIFEKQLLACSIGLSAWSLLTLACGIMGLLHQWFFFCLVLVLVATECGLRLIARVRVKKRESQPAIPKPQLSKQPEHLSEIIQIYRNQGITYPVLLEIVCWLAIALFLFWMLLGASLPSIDFDVKEYHIQGPKEFFQNGQISFLPHNVYTSFPFLTEMLTLSAMVLHGDWYWGAVAGKVVLFSFAPLTALALYCAGNRWFSHHAGILAALFFVSTPWIHRISIIAYAEGGLTFYLMIALFVLILALDLRSTESKGQKKIFLLAGFLAGSAMACKYPGVLTVVLPLFFTAGIIELCQKEQFIIRVRNAFSVMLVYGIGVLLAMGPWLIKNIIETGNPVYPLMYSIMGGADWDPELNTKWNAAHQSSSLDVSSIPFWIVDLTARNDWLSPLLYGFAPLALILIFRSQNNPSDINDLHTDNKKSYLVRRYIILGLWLYVCFLFQAWWTFTHRLDRFWVPMIPVVALLAGVGATYSQQPPWRYIVRIVVVVVLLFNLGFDLSGKAGLNGYLYDYSYLKKVTSGRYAQMNEQLNAENAKVLFVGEAEVFDADFKLIYNTVFDYSIFEQWTAEQQPGVPAADLKMKTGKAILNKFKQEGITHIFVNWSEILRYRPTYGYTDYVHPSRFQQLQDMGILGSPTSTYRNLKDVSPDEKHMLEIWAPELIKTQKGEQIVIRTQLFPLNKTAYERLTIK